MRILVTGANGHIGSHVVRAAISTGHEPVAFVRRGADLRSLERLGVPRQVGDVLDAASLARSMEHCDAVIHAAANFATWGDADAILAPSVVGTRNVCVAAARHRMRRVVVTSSCVVAGMSVSPGDIRDERDWRGKTHLAYYRAKLEGERTAFAEGERLGIETVSVLPTWVLGPGDYRITPSTRMLVDLANGRSPTIDGGVNLVHVDDVALAHIRALERGASGERYIVGGDNVTVRELGNLVARYTDNTLRHLSWPRWAFASLAALMEIGAAVTGRPPPMTRAAVRDVVGRYAWYDCSKTRRVLGIVPRGKEQVIRAALKWLLDRGLLDPAIGAGVRRRIGDDAAAGLGSHAQSGTGR